MYAELHICCLHKSRFSHDEAHIIIMFLVVEE